MSAFCWFCPITWSLQHQFWRNVCKTFADIISSSKIKFLWICPHARNPHLSEFIEKGRTRLGWSGRFLHPRCSVVDPWRLTSVGRFPCWWIQPFIHLWGEGWHTAPWWLVENYMYKRLLEEMKRGRGGAFPGNFCGSFGLIVLVFLLIFEDITECVFFFDYCLLATV